MVEDKYIGLALALAGSLGIGSSFVITKKGLNQAAGRNSNYESASDNLAYFHSPMWWTGMTVMVLGEVANFAAYTFAPPIMVTPLGALSVIIGAALASFLLDEELGHLGRLGCTLCLIGSLIIVLHAPNDVEIETIDQFYGYAVQPGFLMYCFTVMIFSLVMIYIVSPRHGKTNPLVYISICSMVGSVSVMAIKGFGIAIKLTLDGNNQFTRPSTYVFGVVVASCIVVQMNYFNKALDTFSTNVVNPMYFVGFSSATIVASLILFQGFNTTDTTNTLSLLSGFIVIFLGVHILNLSRKPEPDVQHPNGHSALEGGLLNPRISLQGRMSLDGWNGAANGTPRSTAHGRGSSLYHAQSSTLFNAFEEGENEGQDDVVLHQLGGVDEGDEEEEDADERTQLRTTSEARGLRHSPSTPSQGDVRRSPRPL